MGAQANPVGWFEIPVTDMARAKDFYGHVFGFELEEHEMGPDLMAWFPMAEGVVGAAGTLILGEGYVPSDKGVLVYFTTPDIDAALARANEKGGKVLTEKMSIGEYGFIGMILDSEGNRIGLHTRA
jgi:predicted enzyme related to lactoylglutathione lyase